MSERADTEAVTIGACPTPRVRHASIRMGHGSGGLMSRELLTRVFLPRFDDPVLARLEDQATLDVSEGRIAMSTDAFVVRPLFFPGGDIGSLAVHGTVNDLAVGGADPHYLSAAFVLEEGLPLATLERVVDSMATAARGAGVRIVCGDTKVVERGHGDGIFITTTGVGVYPGSPEGRQRAPLSVASARPGDCVLLSGSIAEHGIAVMAAREQLGLEGVLSDVTDVTPLCHALRDLRGLRLMRDATRGGVAAVLSEIAEASSVRIEIDEPAVPLRPEVQAACEVLGLDPLCIANEGKVVAVVAEQDASAALARWQAQPRGQAAAVIGRVQQAPAGRARVSVRMATGSQRLLSLPAGEPLPRIC